MSLGLPTLIKLQGNGAGLNLPYPVEDKERQDTSQAGGS